MDISRRTHRDQDQEQLTTSRDQWFGINGRKSSIAFLLATTALLPMSSLPQIASAKKASSSNKDVVAYNDNFEEALAKVLLSKKVLEPARRYIEVGQYDPARTNVNFCRNQLRLNKVFSCVYIYMYMYFYIPPFKKNKLT